MKAYTLKDSIVLEGIGIHTGEESRIIVHPDYPENGICFYSKGIRIPATHEFVVNTNFSTDIGKDGVLIKTVEHIMAVFHLLQIKGITVELVKGCEIPILDGSGQIFYDSFKGNLIETSEEIEVFDIPKHIKVELDNCLLEAHPSLFTEVTYKGFINHIDCGNEYTFIWNKAEEIIGARTFCYMKDVGNLHRMGYGKGGSLDNVLIIGKGGVYNKEGLRYYNEPLRHKVFDLIGDLYLLGVHVRGKIVSHRGGHTLNLKFIRELSKYITAVRTL